MGVVSLEHRRSKGNVLTPGTNPSPSCAAAAYPGRKIERSTIEGRGGKSNTWNDDENDERE